MLKWLFKRKTYVWKSKDFDIPVAPNGIIHTHGEVKYAEVVHDGKLSFLPLKELVVVWK